MEKRLTRSDFVLMLVFIFMLVVAMGAFFYGMKMGTERTESKYSELLKEKEERDAGTTAYSQSSLVSFYHTVYLPYREFNLKWGEMLDELDNSSSDPASLMGQLSKLAKQQLDATSQTAMPESSPLLLEAQQNYMKSLKLFADASSSLQSRANSMAPAMLKEQLAKDASVVEAINFALTAQKDYYDSIVAWHQTMDGGAKGLDAIPQGDLSFDDWSALSLNLKNDAVAGLLAASKGYYTFTPQDLTLRIDEMLKSGQAKKLGAATITQVMEVLIGTDAVRSGDFVHGKSKYYAGETLPQLPFFSKIE